MPITSDNIKLFASDTMDDFDTGGGAMTGNVIIDNEQNNIFNDISTTDRTYGRVSMRKIFGGVDTNTQDMYYGGHMVITKLPGDTEIGINLFNSEDWFDRRPSAASRVESYRAQGAKYNGWVWGTQHQGSRIVNIFQMTTASIPDRGDVFLLRDDTANKQQYVKAASIEQEIVQRFDQSGVYEMRVQPAHPRHRHAAGHHRRRGCRRRGAHHRCQPRHRADITQRKKRGGWRAILHRQPREARHADI